MQSFTLKNWNKEKLLILIWIVSSYENLMNKLSMDFVNKQQQKFFKNF